jgi:hypothetical protein
VSGLHCCALFVGVFLVFVHLLACLSFPAAGALETSWWSYCQWAAGFQCLQLPWNCVSAWSHSESNTAWTAVNMPCLASSAMEARGAQSGPAAVSDATCI